MIFVKERSFCARTLKSEAYSYLYWLFLCVLSCPGLTNRLYTCVNIGELTLHVLANRLDCRRNDRFLICKLVHCVACQTVTRRTHNSRCIRNSPCNNGSYMHILSGWQKKAEKISSEWQWNPRLVRFRCSTLPIELMACQ